MKQVTKQLFLVMLVFSLTACNTWWSKDDDDNAAYKGMTAKQLYTEAKKEIGKEQYQSAAKRLEALESMYPFSDYAESAQLELIYAYYKSSEYASCAATAERFIHLYPRSARVDYAYYMKGLANFQQTRGTFAAVLPLDESWRDPGTQSQAYSDFATLVQRFPNSTYKANALQRMTYLRNNFALRELNAARYYFVRKMYVATAQRASFLINTYPQAPSVQEALSLLYKSDRALGLTQAAEETLKVFQANYPNQSIEASS